MELRHTVLMSEGLKKVQKRAMRIIFPGHSYDEALQLVNCTRLATGVTKYVLRLHKRLLRVEVHWPNI